MLYLLLTLTFGLTKEEDEPTIDEYGDVWHPVVRKGQ